MTVNIRRFGVGMNIIMNSVIIIWTKCYLYTLEMMGNSNERPGIFDIPITIYFQQLKFVPFYMYIFFILGLLWIIISVVLPEKKISYDGVQLYINNRNTGEYKYSWIIPGSLSFLVFILYIADKSTENGMWGKEDMIIIAVGLILLYCMLIPANIESMRGYTFTVEGIMIHHPLCISIFYPWSVFEEMSFEHERQGSEYNLIIRNSKREYFDKYSPQNVIILYPEGELRYILHFVPEALTETILPLPEKIIEVNREKRKKDNMAGFALFAFYTIVVLAIAIGFIIYVKNYNG